MTTSALVEPVHDTLNNIYVANAALLQSTYSTALQSIVSAAEESFKHMHMNTSFFVAPMQISSAFNVMDHLNWQASLLPDMRWVTALTDQLNTILKIIPDWPSIDIHHVKEKLKQRLIAAFSSVGLCLAPSMSEELMFQILDHVEFGSRRSTITLLIWNYYARLGHRRLQQAVEQWQANPEYKRLWKTRLYPAFKAHVAGEYGLSIGALAPLVEGFSTHIVAKNRLKPKVVTKPKNGELDLGATKDVILRALKAVGDEANLDNDTTSLTHWIRVKSTLTLINDEFCQSLKFEKDYDSIHRQSRRLNRNGLAHGLQVNADTAFNSLRLFLLLDTIFYLWQQYTDRGGRI